MRTSDELTRQHKCSNYRTDIPLSHFQPEAIWKSCQEELLAELLTGTELPALPVASRTDPSITETRSDIPAELNYRLAKKGYRFEDEIQRNNRLYFASRDITRYADSIRTHLTDAGTVLLVPSEEDSTVSFRNETIRVLPTYYTVQGSLLTVVKVKADTPRQTELDETGRQQTVDEAENDESYALMLLARSIRDRYYPEAHCQVEIHHLNDEYVKPKRGEIQLPYSTDFFSEEHVGNITRIEDGFYLDRFFERKWEIEDRFGVTCSGAACSGCGCYTACHFTEPPLIDDTSGLMKNPDDVRLSYAQRQVVNHNHGSLLVDSGAGAGKTTCITMRLLELLKSGVPPEKICLLTFTNAAAKEMKDRVAMYTRSILSDPEKAGQLPPDLDINDITACTFNGLCQKVIEDHYEELGFDRKPQVVPDEIEQQMVHDVFDLYPEKIPGWNYNKASKSIYDKSRTFSFVKSAAAEFLNLVQEIKNTPEDEYRWQAIDKLKDAEGKPLDHRYVVQLKMMVEDFEAAHIARINGLNTSGKAYITYLDQFLLVEKLYEMYPTLWDEYGFSHIIVDEVQDSNTMQMKLLEHIQNNASYQSLCSVGDMGQSIYGFNGAVPENMLHANYESFFGPTEYVSIRENFRCSRNVIGFTNTIIDYMIADTSAKGISVGENEYEHLVGTREETEAVQVQGYYSKQSQFADLAKKMQADLENGIMPGDIMFITRNKTELAMMASELTKLGIPSVLRCPVPYMDNSNVGAALAFMDSYLYGYEEGWFDYCNSLSGGSLFTEETEQIAGRVDAFREEVLGRPHEAGVVLEYLKSLDTGEKDECYQSFLQSFTGARDLADLEARLYAFKQHGSHSTFKREATYGEIQLSTIHSAKGLESKIIYADIGRLDETAFHEPRLTQAAAKNYKETNRLEYVAYTRAKDKLVVTAPYVLRDNGGHPVLNKRLIRAYAAIGKPYGYNFMSYMMEKARNKAEEAVLSEEEAETILMPKLSDFYRQERSGHDFDVNFDMDANQYEL